MILSDPDSVPPPAVEASTELVGFVVRGRRLAERLQINDLDSLLQPDGKWLLPLLRILRTFRVAIEERGTALRFVPESVGAPQLLPKGRTAYLGIAGTRREECMTDKQSFESGDFYGCITGGRVLYGLTERLTVGTILACERDHFHRFLDDAMDDRAYPESSGQAGATMSFLPPGQSDLLQ